MDWMMLCVTRYTRASVPVFLSRYKLPLTALLQTFSLDKVTSGKVIKLVFEQLTDTYGRVIVYNLDLLAPS